MKSRSGGRSRIPKRLAGLAAVCVTLGSAPLYAQQAPFDSEGMARRLAAVEEKDPYRLRKVVRDGPALIAFIDHLCHTCLRSVGPVQELRERFAGRAHVVVIDPAHISAAHTWAKDTYQVWFVPKFVLIDKRGEVAREYFGPTPARTLAADLQALSDR